MVVEPRAASVLIIEGHALIGKALCELLARDGEFDVWGDVRSVEDAKRLGLAPDLILVDMDGLGRDVADVLRACQTAFPRAHLCTLTAHAQSDVMQRCLALGTAGYICKDITPLELVRAVRTVAGGSSYVDPRLAGTLLRRRSAVGGHARVDELTSREIEIVCLIANGFSNKDIGHRLLLSDKTVKNHISRIFIKLNITARTQAAAHAHRNGMV